MYLTNKNPGAYWTLDIETDGLNPTQIWCCVVKNLKTKEVITFLEREEFHAWYGGNEAYLFFIGHNIISFDVPVLNRLYNAGISTDRCVDTLVLSYLYNPGIIDGHSLEAWGRRLGCPKGQHAEWDHFSPEMLAYCKQDIEVTEKLYLAISDRMLQYGVTELACEIEHKIRVILNDQQRNGFWFNRERATSFRDELRSRQSDLTEQIQKLFPSRRTEIARRRLHRTKDGSFTAQYGKDVSKYDHIEVNGDEYVCYLDVSFNIGSPLQRVDRLLDLGWKPTKFTKTKSEKYPEGFPQVDEEALVRFATESGRSEVSGMAEWLVIQGRSSMLDTWLANLGADSRIHGKVLTCGATTRRMIHSAPNCVPLDSQALTRNGWKHYSELVIGEDILAYDMSSKTKKWTPLLDISVFPEAEIYSFGQKHARKRLRCTKNHSWVVRDRDCKGYKNTENLIEAQRLKHNRPIKINAPFDNDILESDFTLIQEKYGYDWVSEICKLSDPELHAMMQGFLLADGCRPKNKKLWEFAQAEGPLLDAFITCLYLISDTRISACQKRLLKGPNQRMGYNVVQTSNMYMRTKDMALRFEEIGPVWCPTTKFGTWVMKQGDFITITGNTANIPSGAKAKYGHECRALWGVEPGRGLVLVGYDAAGLETAGLCHYLNNERATEVLLRSKPNDVHTVNAKRLTEALGWPCDREWVAKTCWYAWLYGAYPKKLGAISGALLHGMSEESAGDIIVDTFFRNVPGLKELINDVQLEWKSSSGRLRCIDGGYVRCPSLSAALNYRIQSMGAIVMKMATILLTEELDKLGIYYKRVGDIHDEGQIETRAEFGDTVGRLAVDSITRAGAVLNCRVNLTGDYKIGQSWDETH